MVEIDKIGYTRVSTIDQDPENQIRIIAAAGIPSDAPISVIGFIFAAWAISISDILSAFRRFNSFD